MRINPIDITNIDFSQFGKFLTIPSESPDLTTSYSKCWGQEYTLPVGEMRFGVEEVQYRDSFTIDKLEQHRDSQEVVIPGNTDFLIALAKEKDRCDYEEHPDISNVVVLCIHPGNILILNQYVWHSGSFPLNENGHYFFMYKVRKETLYWRSIIDGPVELKLR